MCRFHPQYCRNIKNQSREIERERADKKQKVSHNEILIVPKSVDCH